MPKKEENYDNNLKNTEDLVDIIMDENYLHLRDKSFRYITSRYPDLVHENFELPGTFQKKLDNRAFTYDNRNLEMDYAALVGPDEVIKTVSAVNVEHRFQLPDDNEVEEMFLYYISITHETNMIVHSFIITHVDPGVNRKLYRVFGRVICIHFIVVDAKKISQRLSTLSDIIDNNEDLSKVETLDFAYISIFVDVDAKRIMEELAILFKKVKIDDSYLKFDIFKVLVDMIKYHFQDDDVKARELLVMVFASLTDEEYYKLNSYEKALVDLNDARGENSQMCVEISQMRDSLSQRDVEISQMRDNLSRKDEEIKRLKKQLDESNNR